MILFAKRFRPKASQPAVCPLAIPYDMASKTSDSLLLFIMAQPLDAGGTLDKTFEEG